MLRWSTKKIHGRPNYSKKRINERQQSSDDEMENHQVYRSTGGTAVKTEGKAKVTILFVLPAETIYDQQNRVMGWKHTPAPREKLKQLKAITPRLKELGAKQVVCSDLDGQSGWAIARTLGLKCDEWHSLRRLNWGKHHGQSKAKADKEWEQLQEKWKGNPDIPIHNGDSLTSFRNRIAATRERLRKQNGTTVVVAGPFEIQKLIGTEAKLERNRIYAWDA